MPAVLSRLAALKLSLLQADAVEKIYVIEQVVHQRPWSKTKIHACFGNPLMQILGCYSKQELIGYAFIQIVESEVELQNFAISKNFQWLGIGRYFLDELIRHCRNLGLSKIMLEVRESNLPAINLYQASGFSQVGRRPDYYPTEGGKEGALLLTYQFN